MSIMYPIPNVTIFVLLNTEVEPKFQDTLKTELAEALTLVRETPLFDIPGAGRGKLSGLFFFHDAEYICKKYNNLPAVHPMTLEQFNLIRIGIDPKKLNAYAMLNRIYSKH